MSKVAREKKVFASNSVLIAPLDCGSTVSYRISVSPWWTAEIDLADCNRKISWGFGHDNEHDLAKIDNAIDILKEFKREYTKALRAYALLPKED